jgi:hypothetical protein
MLKRIGQALGIIRRPLPLLVSTSFTGELKEGQRHRRDLTVKVELGDRSAQAEVYYRAAYTGSHGTKSRPSWEINSDPLPRIVYPLDKPRDGDIGATRRIRPKTRTEAVALATAHLTAYLCGLEVS